MNKLVVAAASAALFASTALASAQETQGTEGGAQEEMIKKPKAKSGTEATPRQQQQSGESEQQPAPGQQDQQTGESEQQPAPGQQDQQTGESEQQPAPGQQEQQTGEAEGQPSTETTGSIDINTEQRTEITQIFREDKAEPVDIDIDVNVGVAVPRTVTLRPLPPRVIEIVPAYRDYEYFVLADGRIIIVEPGTLKIVYILVV
jgi:DNA mismatch repair ATPase MutL